MVKAGDYDVMDYLWDQTEKSPDPDHITYTAADVEMLWHLGFADAEAFSLEQWQQALAPYRQSDDTFVLSRADFLALDQYRYKGELYAPFDAMLINEGQYTNEGFQELVDASIAPSVGISRDELGRLIDELKDSMRQPNDLLRVDAAVKQKIGGWIEEQPSPLRRMEILFQSMIELEAIEYVEQGGVASAATPQQVATVEASSFGMLSSSTGEKRAKALKALEKAKLPETEPPEDKGPGGAPLHTMRRGRRGVKT